jgi:hypothetical protein
MPVTIATQFCVESGFHIGQRPKVLPDRQRLDVDQLPESAVVVTGRLSGSQVVQHDRRSAEGVRRASDVAGRD